jgi:uncharacterized protein YegP (UPF0339 family)
MFNLLAGNKEIILTSEMYSSETGCVNGCMSVGKNAGADIEDQTVGEEKKNPKFELYQDKAGEFRFRLKASNGENIGRSEGYTAKASAKNGIESVRKNADSEIVKNY